MNCEFSDSFCHSSVSTSGNEAELKQAVLGAADYAFDLLDKNIEDDSMFCLFDCPYSRRRDAWACMV